MTTAVYNAVAASAATAAAAVNVVTRRMSAKYILAGHLSSLTLDVQKYMDGTIETRSKQERLRNCGRRRETTHYKRICTHIMNLFYIYTD